MMVAREIYEHEVEKLKKVESEHRTCAARIHLAEESCLEHLKAKDDI